MRTPEEAKRYNQQYYAKNRTELLAQQRKYHTDHRETIIARMRQNYKPLGLPARKVKNKREQDRYMNNREARLAQQRQSHLRTRYGITAEHFEQMSLLQNHACAICFRIRKLVVDHDHNTGKVRALLCYGCNGGIGLLQESLTVLESAKSYLQKHTTV